MSNIVKATDDMVEGNPKNRYFSAKKGEILLYVDKEWGRIHRSFMITQDIKLDLDDNKSISHYLERLEMYDYIIEMSTVVAKIYLDALRGDMKEVRNCFEIYIQDDDIVLENRKIHG